MNSSEIDAFIKDTQEVASRIKSIDSLISKLESRELQDHYRKEMLDLIEEYHIMTEMLEFAIERFIDNNKNEKVSYLLYHKILKSLRIK